MPTKVKKNVPNFINSETENITEGENHFGFESSTEETTKISLDDGLTINNLSLSYINGFSEESINTDEKINNFNIDNYKTVLLLGHFLWYNYTANKEMFICIYMVMESNIFL